MREAVIYKLTQALPGVIAAVARTGRQRCGNLVVTSVDIYDAMPQAGFADRFTQHEFSAAMVNVGARRVAADERGARYAFEGATCLADAVRIAASCAGNVAAASAGRIRGWCDGR